MEERRFQRNKEDFVCENCSREVKGNGYTNHCTKCLYSKHVDVNPGDRKAGCGGLMKAVDVEKDGEEYFVIQRCDLCSHERRNKVSENDDFDVVIKIANKDLF